MDENWLAYISNEKSLQVSNYDFRHIFTKKNVNKTTTSWTRHWKDHFKNDLRSDQDHHLKIDLISDQDHI
jgi:hypothetical protein